VVRAYTPVAGEGLDEQQATPRFTAVVGVRLYTTGAWIPHALRVRCKTPTMENMHLSCEKCPITLVIDDQ
jgi:hypothetical protein